MEIFAHRGYSSKYPENTMTAFRKALEAGADGIELDARMTQDGKIVVMHDSTVDRTTNGSGKVRELSFAEILSLDAGFKKDAMFENEHIPVLEQVFDELGRKMLINVELCNYEEGDNRMLANQTVDLIEKYRLVDTVIVSSFRFNNLAYIKDRNPNISCALLSQKGIQGWFSRKFLNHSVSVDALHPYYTDVNASMLHKEQLCGRQVRAWTVNNPVDICNLYKMGVNAIFTDDPVSAREYYQSEKILGE